jgi:hypothetical protein
MKRFFKIVIQVVILKTVYEFIKGFIRGWKESKEEGEY